MNRRQDIIVRLLAHVRLGQLYPTQSGNVAVRKRSAFPTPLGQWATIQYIQCIGGKAKGSCCPQTIFCSLARHLSFFRRLILGVSQKKTRADHPPPCPSPLVFGSVFWGRKTRRKLVSFSPLMPNYIISSRTAKKRFIPCAFFLASC